MMHDCRGVFFPILVDTIARPRIRQPHFEFISHCKGIQPKVIAYFQMIKFFCLTKNDKNLSMLQLLTGFVNLTGNCDT